MRVLALGGSLRSGSYSSELLRGAAAAAPDGVEVVLYDGLKEIPPYDADDDLPGEQPVPVAHLKAALAEADAVLVSTPEYNHSIPGVLKNALDWISRPLRDSPVLNKPVAVLSSSTGMFGGVWAAAETRKVLGALGARVLEETVTVPKAHERLANGVDDALAGELRAVLAALAHEVELREPPVLETTPAYPRKLSTAAAVSSSASQSTVWPPGTRTTSSRSPTAAV